MSVLGKDSNGRTAQVVTPALTQAIITTSTTSAQSAAVSSTCTIVEIYSAVDAFYATGANPTAVSTPGASGIRLRGGESRIINIPPGHKIAFILASGTGTAEVTEMA